MAPLHVLCYCADAAFTNIHIEGEGTLSLYTYNVHNIIISNDWRIFEYSIEYTLVEIHKCMKFERIRARMCGFRLRN